MTATDSIYFNVLATQRDEISRLQDSISGLRYSIEQIRSSADAGIAPFWIIVVLVVFIVGIGYLLYKMRIMDDNLTKLERIIEEELMKERHLQVSPKMVHQHGDIQVNMEEADVQSPQILQSSVSKQHVEAEKNSLQSEKTSLAKPRLQRKIVKYASIQEDAQGGLKIAERVMNDDISKMFMVEMVSGDDVATYTFNPRAEASILSDLQTFKNFTEPFTLIGTPRKVVEIKKGQLEKSGKFWIVKRKLKIDFKY